MNRNHLHRGATELRRGSFSFLRLEPSVCFFLVIALAILCYSAKALPVTNWHWRNPTPQGNRVWDVTFGAGRFIGVGDSGTIILSPDGIHWEAPSSGVDVDLTAVTSGSAGYVAAGDEGTIIQSINGVTWTTCLAQTNTYFSGITSGNGIYVAVGQTGGNGRIVYSTNCVQWLEAQPPTTGVVYSACYGNGVFVAFAVEGNYPFTGVLLASLDGMHWSRRNAGIDQVLKFAYGSGVFAAVFGGNSVLVSNNGLDWTSIDTGPSASLDRITYGDGRFVAVGSGVTRVSADGIHWTTTEGPGVPYAIFGGLAYGNGLLVAVPGFSGSILTSADGAQWTARNSEIFQDFYEVAYGNGLFVARGSTGLWRSSNGISWTLVSTNPPIDAMTFGKGKFVGVSSANGNAMSWSSVDGIQWSARSITNGVGLRDIAYGNGLFLTVGHVATGPTPFFSSTDGENWSSEGLAANLPNQIFFLAFANGRFFCLAPDTISSSVDGHFWEFHTTGRTEGFYDYPFDVTFGNGRYVAVGGWWQDEEDYFTVVLTSTNGVDWTRTVADIAECGYLKKIAFGDGYFVAVGEDGISVSENGTTWVPAYPAVTSGLEDVVYSDHNFLAVGTEGSILQTDPIVRLQLQLAPVTKLTLTGPTNHTYRIEAASSLSPTNTWQELTNFSLDVSPASWTDTQATNFPTRFYRSTLVP